MQRDMDLVRAILVQLEESGEVDATRDVGRFPGYGVKTIAGHIEIMEQANLVEAELLKSSRGIETAVGFGPTWDGHEFLELARNDTVWNKTKAIVKEKGGGFSLEIVKALLISVAKAHFGIPGS